MSINKWLFYTVIMGALPFIIRLFFFAIRKDLASSYIINAVDMVTFGLVLNVSNINDLENWDNIDEKEKTEYRRISMGLIIVLSVFLGFAYVADLDKTNQYDINVIKSTMAGFAFVSLIFIGSIYLRYRKK